MKQIFWIETWFYLSRRKTPRLPIVVKSAVFKQERFLSLLRPYLKAKPYFGCGQFCFTFALRLYPFWIHIVFDD